MSMKKEEINIDLLEAISAYYPTSQEEVEIMLNTLAVYIGTFYLCSKGGLENSKDEDEGAQLINIIKNNISVKKVEDIIQDFAQRLLTALQKVLQ